VIAANFDEHIAEDVTAAVNPGQTLLLGKLVDIIALDDPTAKANFLALMLLVLSLGCFVCYYALGWSMNVIANVSFYFEYNLFIPTTNSIGH
jgi:hypothetical protein